MDSGSTELHTRRTNTRTREEKGRKGENAPETRRDALLHWVESDLQYTPCPYKYDLERQICRTSKECCADWARVVRGEVINVEETEIKAYDGRIAAAALIIVPPELEGRV